MSSSARNEASDGRARMLQARRELYRSALVEAAEVEFAAAGYDGVKVQSIARRAGVSLATFYAAFPGKWEVFRAVQEDRLAILMREVGTAVMAARTSFDRLRLGIEGYLRFHIEHPNFLKMQLREHVPWGTTDELRTPEQTRAWEAGLQMLIAGFRSGMAEGLLEPDDPELCARTATAMSQVRLVRWIDRGMADDVESVVGAAMRQFVRTFVRLERQADVLVGL
ncbi:MAG: TetR/AcrR family transcriptional regulator [Deltaproteobacteria bacterium]|nr:TetR/AcrR family transcriptional regulator [Deltaproteobacteria bacterium]MBK8717407.1 TetR/AcrR family transcriptional regulator [Deltaproteobacteria bacterium]MBP7286274.1 TetR/AcrR family transcriptional regulator [Nannocystaceae bacterium]